MMRVLPKMQLSSIAKAKKDKLHRSILEKEAEIGGRLFGEVLPGNKRNFFCLDRHTWVWHEEWFDNSNQKQILTTYYHVRPNVILKSYGDQNYKPLEQKELNNFLKATQLYLDIVPNEITKFYSNN